MHTLAPEHLAERVRYIVRTRGIYRHSRANSVLIKPDTKAIMPTYVGDDSEGRRTVAECGGRPLCLSLHEDAFGAYDYVQTHCRARVAGRRARPDQIINNYHGRRPDNLIIFSPQSLYNAEYQQYINLVHTRAHTHTYTRLHSFGRQRARSLSQVAN